MITPNNLLSIDNYNTYNKVCVSICHGKKDSAFDMPDSIKELQSRLKKGDVMDRFSRLLGKFSREKSEAKLAQHLNKKVEAPEANANGTSGYLIKEGKNAGKVLKHIKTDRTKL